MISDGEDNDPYLGYQPAGSPEVGPPGAEMSDDDVIKQLGKIYSSNQGMTLACLRAVARLVKGASLREKLPTDPRTILRTMTTRVGNRNFVHLGLVRGLLLKIQKGIHPSAVCTLFSINFTLS